MTKLRMWSSIKDIKKVKRASRSYRSVKLGQLFELEWAHVYKETIRGKKWLEDLGISPGRWAGNYSLFYILIRILSDFKPKKILEFGLGESSKLISSFLENELENSTQLIIEQSSEWIENFNSRFSLSARTRILHLPLAEKIIKRHKNYSYREIEKNINEAFDLYIIDGPTGSYRYSRHDICILSERFRAEDDFIVIIDDSNRLGEIDTAKDLVSGLNKKGIKTYSGRYSGNKSQIVIATEKYKYAISL